MEVEKTDALMVDNVAVCAGGMPRERPERDSSESTFASTISERRKVSMPVFWDCRLPKSKKGTRQSSRAKEDSSASKTRVSNHIRRRTKHCSCSKWRICKRRSRRSGESGG